MRKELRKDTAGRTQIEEGKGLGRERTEAGYKKVRDNEAGREGKQTVN